MITESPPNMSISDAFELQTRYLLQDAFILHMYINGEYRYAPVLKEELESFYRYMEANHDLLGMLEDDERIPCFVKKYRFEL